MTEEKKAPAKNRPKKRRRPNSNRKKAGAGPEDQAKASGAPNRRNNKKRRSGNRRNNNNNNKGPKLTGLERLIVKYENLRDQHIEARRKYYDLFERADPQQKDKLERVFSNTMVKLREFEDNLKPEDKQLFDKHYNGYKLDLIYSENHQLDPEGDQPPPSDQGHEDPHYLESQKSCDFSGDDEESVGSLEDYNAYKGL